MKTLLPVLVFVAFVPFASAQIVTVAAWDFAGYTGTGTAAATTTDSNYTVSSLTATNLTSQHQGNDSDIFGWGNWNETNSIDTGEYLEFSVTPDVGVVTTYSSLDMYWVRESGSSGGPRRYQIYVSDDGFVSSAIAESKQATIGNSATDGLLSWDLSKVDVLENVSTTLTFRIYGWRSGGDYGGMGLNAGDDLILQGEVVPEPSTYALIFGCVALGIAIFRKRAKRAEASA